MRTFREAWAEVASILIVDPVILPTSNNRAAAPFELLYSAFPTMTWVQPRNNWRAVVKTPKYLTAQFAEELAPLLGCAAGVTWARVLGRCAEEPTVVL